MTDQASEQARHSEPPAMEDQTRWTASQACTFLAFGRPISADELKSRTRQLLERWDHAAANLVNLERKLLAATTKRKIQRHDSALLEALARRNSRRPDQSISPDKMLCMVREDLSYQQSLERAEAELIEACRSGQVSCRGHRRGDDRQAGPLPLPREVPPQAWVAGIGLRYDEMHVGDRATNENFIRIRRMSDELFVNLDFASGQIVALRQVRSDRTSTGASGSLGVDFPSRERRAPTSSELDEVVESVFGLCGELGMLPPSMKALSQAVRCRLSRRGIWSGEKVITDLLRRTDITDRIGKKGVRNNGRLRPFRDSP